jgi:hypothetical protein
MKGKVIVEGCGEKQSRWKKLKNNEVPKRARYWRPQATDESL